jgi:hypothetical protein
MPGYTTLSVLAKFGGHQAVALIDSGSTTTFLDSEFVKKANLQIKSTVAQTVLVAGGGELISDGIVPLCKFKIQDTNFQQDCKILPLKGYDMVLGANWLKQHGPNYTDWEHRSISITIEGQWCTFLDRAVPTSDTLISAQACSKLLRQGAQAYLIRVTSQSTEAAPTPRANQSEIADILEQYADIFAEPTGLPPHRSCDHKIPTQEGANPPNVRPYRMPHT